jgi:hypothetical protein
MSRAPVALALTALGYVALSRAGRRWHRTWGAGAGEAAEELPGDDLITRAALQTTRAIDIDAGTGDVWPWLVQMGQGRGGFYTYTPIENLIGARIRNLDRIEPSLQKLEVGDRIRLTPEIYLGRIPGQYYTVREIRPPRTLVMSQELPTGGLSSWTFELRPLDGGRTRLLVRGRSSAPAGAREKIARELELTVLEPGYFLMERGMLRGLRTRAERSARPSFTARTKRS